MVEYDELVARNRARTAAKNRRTGRQRVRLAVLRLLAPLVSPRPTPHASRFTSHAAHILLIRPDHLGDLLFCTPALHRLRQQFPQAEITALVGPWAAPVLEGNPDVDRVVTCPFPGFERRPKASPLQPYVLLWQWAQRLRAGRFDRALILRPDHWWGAWLAALAGIPRRTGYTVAECAPFLSDARPLLADRHEVERSLALVEDAVPDGNFSPADHPLRFFARPGDAAFADNFLRANGLRLPVVAIHPGAGAAVKRWPADRWARVGDALVRERGAAVVLTGSAAERALCQEIADHMQTRPVIAAGQTTLGQLAALYSRCALVLGPDSGPLHLAVAVGTPTVHLFGPADARKFGPWGDPARHVVLRSPLGCAPCGHLDWDRLEEHPCMQLIDVEEVVEVAAITGL